MDLMKNHVASSADHRRNAGESVARELIHSLGRSSHSIMLAGGGGRRGGGGGQGRATFLAITMLSI